MITLAGVNKTFLSRDGEIKALNCIDVEIAKGEFVVVHGPSGCGKSTLLMTMAGILRPTSGAVLIAENNLYESGFIKRNRLRAKYLGFVFQMFHLVPYLNVIENVILAGPAAAKKADTVRAKHMLGTLGLSERISHRSSQLSSGEKQRVALARALFNNPPILLADEPTGNLDSENASEVIGHLAEFQKSGGTVVVATHGESADDYASRVIQLREGRIEGAGAA